MISNASGKAAVSAVSDVELGYLAGVGSSIQTQFTNKQDTILGGASSITASNLTINKALISNASGKVAVSNVSDIELGCFSCVSSTIQTQLNRTNNMVKFISDVGSVFYTPTTGSNLPALIMTAEGGTIATFKHGLIFFNKNLDAGAYDVKPNTLSSNCLTQLDTCVKILVILKLK